MCTGTGMRVPLGRLAHAVASTVGPVDLSRLGRVGSTQMGGEEGAVVATQCADPELDDSSDSAAQVCLVSGWMIFTARAAFENSVFRVVHCLCCRGWIAPIESPYCRCFVECVPVCRTSKHPDRLASAHT